jgi:adhesin transport system membrane fusion protein
MKDKKHLTQKDYEFMQSLSAAILQVTPKKVRYALFFWLVAVSAFIVWSYNANIDEIVRGGGEVIPSGENIMIQNLEGGIVDSISIDVGDIVQKDQILLKIDNKISKSTFSSNTIKANALEAKMHRLKAESNDREFIVGQDIMINYPDLVANERSLFETNKKELNSKLKALKEKYKQKAQELLEAQKRLKNLKSSLDIINTEVQMTEPMVIEGVRSKIDFLKLKREANDIQDQYDSVNLSIPRLESAIKEADYVLKETKLTFQNEAKQRLNEVVSELETIKASNQAVEDQVDRTVVKSPINGVVQSLFINSVGGVIKPGANILEIVPSDQALLVEAKIKPSDIAFIYNGQKAIVKFSAYDFAIYGGLTGKVVNISADTIEDKNDDTYYTVQIKTAQNYITNKKNKKLKIIPGMTVDVNIIVGQKSVLDYILKPILKTKEVAFTDK